jgi:1-hydroxy-2-isopentenylcarotenoid 3,4-desaturase
MYQIIRALQAQSNMLGVVYKKRKNVEKIIVEKNTATGVLVDGKADYADLIISNSDLYHTENAMLSEENRTYSQSYWSKRQAGPSTLLMYLGVKGELPELEHHNLYFVDTWKENFEAIYETKKWPDDASIYISKTSSTDKTAPKDHETVFVLVPLPASLKKMQKKTIEKYTEKYLAQIENITDIKDFRQRIIYKEIRTPDYFGETFSSWNNTALGMSHTLRQSAFFRPSVKHKKVKNLYMVGAGVQPGIGVPMCLISAELVYKNIIGDSTSGPLEGVIS